MLPWKACAVGDPVESIDTPSLVLDLDVFERNLSRMAKEKGRMRLRPHAKSHKCPEIAKAQIRHGAVGICCQKLSEAAVFAQAGITDILVTNQIVGEQKLRHVRELAQTIRLGVLVDHPQQVERLAQVMAGSRNELDVYIELDVGAGRCGTTIEQSVMLARMIHALDGIRFAGLHAYHGAAQHLREPAQRAAAIASASSRAGQARKAIEAVGMSVPIVTGAGTGTFWHERDSGIYDELQPGSYIFMDRDYADNQIGNGDVRFEHALFLLATVQSLPSADVAVVDAGLKASSVDSGMPAISGRPDLKYVKASDEHGVIRTAASAMGEPVADQTTGHKLCLGDRLWLIPGHCDPTVNLYDDITCIRDGKVQAIWPVSARGACL